MVIILMGVTGVGKTIVGEMLAAELGCHFYDGDDFHPSSNIEKMSNGIPLTDEDREPWLQSLRNLIEKHIVQDRQAVVACSALKQVYREKLSAGLTEVKFVYLFGEFKTIWRRLKDRKDHFMKKDMLQSQFEMLEEPEYELQFSNELEPEEIVQQILKNISETV
jgi:carbohydrate kinase (thermoresistant glucokinase family)